MRSSATGITLDLAAAGKTVSVPRLRTVSPKDPGWTRRRAGKGFVYLDQTGGRLADEDVQRCRLLVIPPAWEQVWICPRPNGHLQAVGTDAAGRRQYIYHEQWRRQRDKSKHDRVLTVAGRLPPARRSVAKDLQLEGMPLERALGTAFRLLDLGFFRIGGEAYAEQNHTYGLATIQKQHVSSRATPSSSTTSPSPARSATWRWPTTWSARPVATCCAGGAAGRSCWPTGDGRVWRDVTRPTSTPTSRTRSAGRLG